MLLRNLDDHRVFNIDRIVGSFIAIRPRRAANWRIANHHDPLFNEILKQFARC